MLVPAVATLRDHFVWCANLNAHQSFAQLIEQDNGDTGRVFYCSQCVQNRVSESKRKASFSICGIVSCSISIYIPLYLSVPFPQWLEMPTNQGNQPQGFWTERSRRPGRALKSSLCFALTAQQDFHKTKLKPFSPLTGFYDKSKKFLQFNCFCQLQKLF